MEREEILSMLEVIEQQMSSTILGGVEADYEELERLGYIVIHRESIPHSATMTDRGMDYLRQG